MCTVFRYTSTEGVILKAPHGSCWSTLAYFAIVLKLAFSWIVGIDSDALYLPSEVVSTILHHAIVVKNILKVIHSSLTHYTHTRLHPRNKVAYTPSLKSVRAGDAVASSVWPWGPRPLIMYAAVRHTVNCKILSCAIYCPVSATKHQSLALYVALFTLLIGRLDLGHQVKTKWSRMHAILSKMVGLEWWKRHIRWNLELYSASYIGNDLQISKAPPSSRLAGCSANRGRSAHKNKNKSEN